MNNALILGKPLSKVFHNGQLVLLRIPHAPMHMPAVMVTGCFQVQEALLQDLLLLPWQQTQDCRLKQPLVARCLAPASHLTPPPLPNTYAGLQIGASLHNQSQDFYSHLRLQCQVLSRSQPALAICRLAPLLSVTARCTPEIARWMVLPDWGHRGLQGLLAETLLVGKRSPEVRRRIWFPDRDHQDRLLQIGVYRNLHRLHNRAYGHLYGQIVLCLHLQDRLVPCRRKLDSRALVCQELLFLTELRM
mmetsp:Transcript_106612/g.200858  ORF Transcript_106612/g.200858 Transcript_106612/m.200858 type:complete len:247 (-) Transcript_106612:413-1153(-)